LHETDRTLAQSSYADYCDGASLSSSDTGCAVIGVVLSTATVSASLPLPASPILGAILAFDAAERASAYIGQINMTVVSSFCGPDHLIWGYDLARPENLLTGGRPLELAGQRAQVYRIEPLLDATTRLFGTAGARRFPFRPGSVVPCAACHIERAGPRRLYCGLAIGIAEHRDCDACVLMEDVGEFPLDAAPSGAELVTAVLDDLARSVMRVGVQQQVAYHEIFVGMREVQVDVGDIGSALIACPYFTPAQRAIPGGSADELTAMSLAEWDAAVAASHAQRRPYLPG
jgi:histidine decarboxylase